jgi:hypothetical protein
VRDTKRRPLIACIVAVMLAPTAAAAEAHARHAPQEKKDYLTDSEADKIRDAYDPGDRIKLFMSFADDRLKKFEYELTRQTPDVRHDEMLNSLMNAFSGCVDDAADQIDVAKKRQVDIHRALKLMESKLKEYLPILQKLDKGSGPDYEAYKDTLEDAIQGSQDALSDVTKAEKEMLPPPVRREQ